MPFNVAIFWNMKKKNVLFALICFLILAAGVFVVCENSKAAENALVSFGLKAPKPMTADAVPYIQKLRDEIPVIGIERSKKKENREIWKVSKGVSFPNYLVRAQNHLKKFGGKVLYMEELSKDRQQVVDFDFVAPFGDTFRVELRMGESFGGNTSKLAVGFYAGSELPKFVEDLNKLNYPYSMLISPSAKAFFESSLSRLKAYSPVIWLPMESRSDIPGQFKSEAIKIHHSEPEIQEIVSDAMKKIPNASGIATRWGDRAVEQETLFRPIFSILKERDMWFMDLTGNRYSKTDGLCEKMQINCRTESPFNPNRMTQSVYVKNTLTAAQRTGKAILLLPLSNGSFKAIEGLKDSAEVQGTEIVELSGIFQPE